MGISSQFQDVGGSLGAPHQEVHVFWTVRYLRTLWGKWATRPGPMESAVLFFFECGPLARVPCVCPGRVRWGRASLRKPAPYRPTGPAEGDWLELPAHLPTPACSVRARSPMLSFSLVLVVCPFCPPASQSREGKVVTTQAFHLITAVHQAPLPPPCP